MKARITIKDILLLYISIGFLWLITFPVMMLATGWIADGKYFPGTFHLAGTSIALVAIFRWAKKRTGLSRADLGLRRGRWRPAISAFVGIAIGFLVVFILFPVLSPYKENLFPHLSAKWLKQTLLAPLTLLGFSMIFALPVVEELLYRGILYSYLKSKVSVLLATTLQAIVFSLAHLGYLSGDFRSLPYYFFVGCILAYLFETSDSLYPPIVAHGTLSFLSASSLLSRQLL